jgi:DNA-binding Lrp family transcriptional regulator
MLSNEEIVLKELRECSRISNIRIFLEYFISPRKLHKIIRSLEKEGHIIAHINYFNKEYSLARDKNGVFYE